MLNRLLLRSTAIMLWILSMFFTTRLEAQIIYVDSANIVGIHDGLSWATAFNNFSDGVTAAIPGDSIWVAKGTYQPAANSSFTMKNGVAIYGGFTGTELTLTSRNWHTNPTLLEGNSATVILNSLITSSALLDGFTITGGNTSAAGTGGGMTNNTSSPTLNNIIFLNNFATSVNGGGMYNAANSSPTLTNVIFYGNTAFTGGGMFNTSSSPILINVAFVNNISTTYGGGILNGFSSSPVLTNLTFSGNNAISGGGIYNGASATPTITNCIFWGNTAAAGNDIFNNGSTPSITYCFTQTATIGTGNITGITDPFVNDALPAGTDGIFMTEDDGLELIGCSPAVNTGNTAINTATIDIAAQQRVFNTTIDIGAYEYQSLPDGTSLALNNDMASQTIYPGINSLIPTGTCRIIGQLLSSGANPVADTVSSQVWIDPVVQTYLGQPYVQRHFDITPAINAAAATATVILFVTQAEFDAFNAVSSTQLPTGPSDAIGKANLNIVQFHGISATGIPGTYSPGTPVLIDPNDANIVWNNTLNRWEITFDVNGFSGFIITTNGTILSLNLLSFTGELVNGKTQLQWQTANEVNTDHFEVDKSTDGKLFTPLTNIKANGTGNNSYTTVDEQTQSGDNYYQLKSFNKDGSYTRSNIILIKVDNNDKIPFVVYPNPTNNQLVLEYDNISNAIITIYNLAGQRVLTTSTQGQSKTPIDVSNLAAGTYIIEYNSETETLRDKFVKAN